jgi:hypothetical protein
VEKSLWLVILFVGILSTQLLATATTSIWMSEGHSQREQAVFFAHPSLSADSGHGDWQCISFSVYKKWIAPRQRYHSVWMIGIAKFPFKALGILVFLCVG